MISFEEFNRQVRAFFNLIDAEQEVKVYRVTNDREVLWEAQQGFNVIQYKKMRDWRFHGNGAVGAGNTLLGAFANYSVLLHQWVEKERLEQLERQL